MKFFHQLFEAKAEEIQTQDNVAIFVDDLTKITYRDLNARANQLANYLLDQKQEADTSDTPETFIGLFFTQSIEYVISMLAVMKAGMSFVPFSSNTEFRRLQEYGKACEIKQILFHSSLKNHLFLKPFKDKMLALDAEEKTLQSYPTSNPSVPIELSQLAYVHNTSGTEGKPKQVLINHSGILNCATDLIDRLQISAKDKIAAYSDISFDAHIAEIMMTLGAGASFYLVPDDVRLNYTYLAHIYKSWQITVATLTPTVLNSLPSNSFPALRVLLSTGEAIAQSVIKKWSEANPNLLFVNGYGPAEVTIATSIAILKHNDPIHIGSAIKGLTIYILEKEPQDPMTPKWVKPGERGEMYIGGAGVGRGYMSVELTKLRFHEVSDPDNPTQKIRLYQTRDEAFYEVIADKSYRFYVTGRLDRQLKVYGKLICPEEIEALLIQHDDVVQAQVKPQMTINNHPSFIAFLHTRNNFDLYEYYAGIAKQFPASVGPARWVLSDKPLVSTSGKNALKSLDESELKAIRAHSHSPLKSNLFSSGTAIKLVQLWRDILDIDESIQFGIDDNFFMLGGTSIQAEKLIALINQHFKIKITITELTYLPTIAALERKINRLENKATAENTPYLLNHKLAVLNHETPLFLIHSLMGDAEQDYEKLVANWPGQRPIYVISSRAFKNIHDMDNNLEAIAQDYIDAMRSKQRLGPYFLGGWSAGGLIAYAMAQILKNQSETVHLHMIDSEALGKYRRKSRAEYADYLLELFNKKLIKLFPTWSSPMTKSELDPLPKTKQIYLYCGAIEEKIDQQLVKMPASKELQKNRATIASIKNTLLAILNYAESFSVDNAILWAASKTQDELNERLLWGENEIEFKAIHRLEGDHESIVLLPQSAKTLGLQLEKELKSVEEKIEKVYINRGIVQEEISRSISNLPKLVKQFQPRVASQELISRLNDLRRHQSVPLLAITGIAGSGKSELAKYYALEEKNAAHEKIVCWQFDVETQEKLLWSYRNLLAEFKIDWTVEENESHTKAQERLHSVLQQRMKPYRFIWIFDNARDYKNIAPYLITLSDLKGDIIVTTQNSKFFNEEEANFSISKGLKETEALSLLDKLSGLTVERAIADAKDVAKELDYLPLAVSTAALYIKSKNSVRPGRTKPRKPYGFNQYLIDLKSKTAEVEKKEENSRNQYEYSRTQGASLRLAIENTDWQFRQLLDYCVWLDTQALPRPLLEYLFNFILQKAPTDSDSDSEEAFDDFVKASNHFDLLGIDDEAHVFYLHRSTQLQLRQLAKSTLSLADWKAKKQHMLGVLTNGIATCYPVQRHENDPAKFKKYGAVIAHIESIAYELYLLDSLDGSPSLESKEHAGNSTLDHFHRYIQFCNYSALYSTGLMWGEKIVELINKNQNLSPYLADFMNVTGVTLTSVGKLQQALTHLEKELNIREQNEEKSHLEAAFCLSNLGSVWSKLGNAKKSLECDERALKIRQDHYGKEDHPDIATSLDNMAGVLGTLARFNESLDYYGKALTIRRKIYSGPHPDVAYSLGGIGVIWFSLGNSQKALSFYDQTLAIRKEIYGLSHPSVALVLANIGTAWLNLGDAKQALRYQEQALTIRKAIYGDSHPDVASSLGCLGNIWFSLGDYKQSFTCHEQALAMRQKFYGDCHPDIALSLGNIGGLWSSMGDYKQSLHYHQQALDMRQTIYGDMHPDVATSLNNLGIFWFRSGNYNKALDYYEQALAMRKKIYGDSHPDIASSLGSVGSALSSLGKYEQSSSYYKESLNLRREVYNDCHPDIATALGSMGGVLASLGQYKESLDYNVQAYEMRKKIYGDFHPDIASSLNSLSSAWFNCGDYKTALSFGNQAFEMRKTIYGDSHPDVAASLASMSMDLSNLGKYKEALGYSEQALKIRKKIYGDIHPDVASSLARIAANLSGLGKYKESLTHYEQALSIRKEIYGELHPLFALNLDAIGCTWSRLGNEKKSLEYSEKALAILEKTHSASHPDIANSLKNIGISWSILDDSKQAITYFHRALDIYRKIYGDSHSQIASCLDQIGVAWGDLGDSKQCLAFYKQGLAMREQIHSDPHPDVANSLENMGSVLSDLGQEHEALACYERAHEIWKKVYGDDPHPEIASSLLYVGGSYRELADYKKALDFYTKALEMQKKFYDDSHPKIASALYKIGDILVKLGKIEEALESYEKSLSIRIARYGNNHSSVANCLEEIGYCWHLLGKNKEAIEYYKKSLAIQEQLYGDKDHSSISSNLTNLGDAYSALGEYQEALIYHKKALEMDKRLYGEEHPDLAVSLSNMGDICAELGDYNEALRYQNQSLAIKKKIHGDSHPNVAVVLTQIGCLYTKQGNYNEALHYHEQALEMDQKFHDESHPTTAVNLGNVGAAYASLGDYNKALAYHERALAIKKKIRGDSHFSVAISLSYIGNAHSSLGRYKEALSYHEQAFAINKELYGESHPEVAANLSNMGSTYSHLANYNEMLNCYKRGLEIKKKIYGNSHPSVAISLNYAGNAHSSLGDYKEALDLYEQALAINEKVHGKVHPEVASNLANISIVLSELGEDKKALEYLEHVFEIRKKFLPNSHPNIASTMSNIGWRWKKLGNARAAFTYYEQALAIQKNKYGDSHPAIATSYISIGSVYLELGELNKAMDYFEQALAIRIKFYDEDHSDVAGAMSYVALAWSEFGMLRKALFYHKKVLAIYKKTYGDSHSYVATSLNSIGICLNRLGQSEKALAFCNQGLEMRKNRYGDSHSDVASSYSCIASIQLRLGDPQQALYYQKIALDISTKLFTDTHPDVAIAHNKMGSIYLRLGNAPEAIQHYQYALNILKFIYGDSHSTIAISLNGIGRALSQSGNPAKAIEKHQQAFKIQKSTYRNSHPDMAASFNGIGIALFQLKDLPEALTYHEKTRIIQQDIFNDTHPNDLIDTLENISRIYKEMGNEEKSLNYCKQAKAVQENSKKEEYPDDDAKEVKEEKQSYRETNENNHISQAPNISPRSHSIFSSKYGQPLQLNLAKVEVPSDDEMKSSKSLAQRTQYNSK